MYHFYPALVCACMRTPTRARKYSPNFLEINDLRRISLEIRLRDYCPA